MYAVEAIRAVAGAILLPVDKGQRSVGERIGDRFADEISLVAVKNRARFSKDGLVLEIGEAKFGRAIEHGPDGADAIGERPEIGRAVAVEMLLDIKPRPGSREQSVAWTSRQ
jgi:hypothetical protein